MYRKLKNVKRVLFPDTDDSPEQATESEYVPQSKDKTDGQFVDNPESASHKQEDVSATVNAEEDLEDVPDTYINELKVKLLLYGSEFFNIFPEQTDIQRVYDYKFNDELSVPATKNISCNSVLSTSRNDTKKHTEKLQETSTTNENCISAPSISQNDTENIKDQSTDKILDNAESGNESSPETDPRKKEICERLRGRIRMCDIRGNSIRCTLMDPVTKKPLRGEVLENVPTYRWSTNVICGQGEKMVMGQVTGPKTHYYRSAISADGEWPIFDPSSSSSNTKKIENELYVNTEKPESIPSVNLETQENVPAASGKTSPNRRKKNKFSKNTRPKSSAKRENQVANVGEQTPHSESSELKLKRVPPITPDAQHVANKREEAARSPDCIRVRDLPIPPLSWVDSTELSLLMNCKEDIGITERNPTVFRRTHNLTSRMRAILFEWLMEVCAVYKLRRVTYYLAVDYIDRYLSHTDSIKKKDLQLVGISCLFIAAKLEEIYPPKLSELAYVTDGACTDIDMLVKELDVISVLRWDVAPMTVIGWLTLFLQLSCTTGNEIRGLGRNNETNDDIIYPQFSPYQLSKGSMILDLASLDDGMLQFKYSVIAASVVYYTVNREKALFVSGYHWEDIRCCVEWLYPFAIVAYKNLSIKALPIPKEKFPRSSALRVVNPNIVLEEAHIIQTNIVDLKLLEEVYEVVAEMRRGFRTGVLKPATGWSASNEGQGFDVNAVQRLMDPPLPRKRRTQFRTSSFAQSATRNTNRVYHNKNIDPPIVISSDSDEAVPSVAGSTSSKQKAHDSKSSQSSSFEEQDSSSLMTGSSPDLAAEPLVKLHFVDSNKNKNDQDKSSDSNSVCNVNRVQFKEARLVDNTKKSPELKRTEEIEERATEDNQDEDDSDNLSCSSSSNQNLGEKRRRSDADDEDSDENENSQPRRKKSCYERKSPCGQMLASPACSGMYLKEGEKASFLLKPNEPERSMRPPEHPEVLPTRGSHLRMEVFAKVVPKRIPDYVIVDSQFIQTVKDGYYSVKRVTE